MDDYVKSQVREYFDDNCKPQYRFDKDSYKHLFPNLKHAEALTEMIRWVFGDVDDEDILQRLAPHGMLKDGRISHHNEWVFWMDFIKRVRKVVWKNKLDCHGKVGVTWLYFLRKHKYYLNCVYKASDVHQVHTELTEIFDHMSYEYPNIFKLIDLSVDIVEIIPELEVKPETAIEAAK